ncbi:secreted RxLR effector peptide protein, putative [Phytophthora infestans T30-4]|uniref:Secreted RxLR effector peptide protein, putative n=1 Tax=Phytophthora infestans (strain T30-4) TaxID=403677 RepID=D0NF36_PHYIT|nr:secreted RxLR effector peptide protein, putative [Phytophthora infestans T30-4]EEY56825.1 secreted RxLR effector peptide protein, putative [Phytophthora infestans T30-4]|eukprot:XP_002902153.1 secreted RxLR effector peptide protein, putative [Phytophthora infestans T30-4]
MIRLFVVVLLIFAASLACAAKETTSVRTTHNYLDEKYSAPVQRLLRADNDEERVAVENALNSVMTSISKAIDSAKLKVFLLKKSSGDVVMNSLKFGDDAAAALEHSKMKTLNTYATKFNKENPDKTISLVGTLTTRYGDDGLARALVKVQTHADSSAEAVALAKKLRAEQLSAWLESQRSEIIIAIQYIIGFFFAI